MKQLIYEDGDFLLTFLFNVEEFGLEKGGLTRLWDSYFASLERLLERKRQLVLSGVHNEFLKQNLLSRKNVGINERLRKLKLETSKTKGHRTRSRLGWLLDLNLLRETESTYEITPEGNQLLALCKQEFITERDSSSSPQTSFCLVPPDSEIGLDLGIRDDAMGLLDRRLLNAIAIGTYVGNPKLERIDNLEFLKLLWRGYERTKLPHFDVVETDALEEFVSDTLAVRGIMTDFQETLESCHTEYSEYFDLLSNIRGGRGIVKFKKALDEVKNPMGNS